MTNILLLPLLLLILLILQQVNTQECNDIANWVDSTGDGCAYYEGKTGFDDIYYDDGDQGESRCDVYGNGYFNLGHTAATACCVCGGGSTFISTCKDIKYANGTAWIDAQGDGCDYYGKIFVDQDDIYYDDGDTICSYWGDELPNAGYTASEVCCICGGGYRNEGGDSEVITSIPTGAPTKSQAPTTYPPAPPPPVWCGGHSASSCSTCPVGSPNGPEEWCNGECDWMNGECVDLPPTSSPLPSTPPVWCGGHSASSCSTCPVGSPNGPEEWCNGECDWIDDECKKTNTPSPTKEPFFEPTKSPTSSPSDEPYIEPPTKSPTKSPTKVPTKSPTTKSPTKHPTKFPTNSPTTRPTLSPQPTKNGYIPPSFRPTLNPSLSVAPSKTMLPTSSPSLSSQPPSISSAPTNDVLVLPNFELNVILASPSASVDVDEFLSLTEQFLSNALQASLFPNYDLKQLSLTLSSAVVSETVSTGANTVANRVRRKLDEVIILQQQQSLSLTLNAKLDGTASFKGYTTPSTKVIADAIAQSFIGESNSVYVDLLQSAEDTELSTAVSSYLVYIDLPPDDDNGDQWRLISAASISASIAVVLLLVGVYFYKSKQQNGVLTSTDVAVNNSNNNNNQEVAHQQVNDDDSYDFSAIDDEENVEHKMKGNTYDGGNLFGEDDDDESDDSSSLTFERE